MSNLLFSTDTDSGIITVIDADSVDFDEVAIIPVGNGPRGAVKFTKHGRGYVTNHAGNTISEIDAYSLREIDRIKVGIAPIGLTIIPGDRYALVSNAGDNDVSVVDLGARRETHRFTVGREPRHPDTTPDGQFSYVPISGGDYVSKVDVSALKEDAIGALDNVREIAKIYLGEGTMPYSVAVSPDGGSAIAANNQQPYVSIIDVNSDNIIHQVDVGVKGARGSAFTPDSAFGFVTLENTSEVIVIDMKAGKVVERYDVGPGPRGVLFDAAKGTLFATAFDRTKPLVGKGNSVSVLHFTAGVGDLAALKTAPQLRDVSVGAGPCSVSMFVKN